MNYGQMHSISFLFPGNHFNASGSSPPRGDGMCLWKVRIYPPEPEFPLSVKQTSAASPFHMEEPFFSRFFMDLSRSGPSNQRIPSSAKYSAALVRISFISWARGIRSMRTILNVPFLPSFRASGFFQRHCPGIISCLSGFFI